MYGDLLRLFSCLSVCLSVCPSFLSVYLVCLSVCLSIFLSPSFLSAHISVCPSFLSVCLIVQSASLSVCPYCISVCLFDCPICLSVLCALSFLYSTECRHWSNSWSRQEADWGCSLWIWQDRSPRRYCKQRVESVWHGREPEKCTSYLLSLIS